MTREKQIIEKAGKESEIFYKVNDNYGDCFHGGFIDGAKWADANQPSPWISVEDKLPDDGVLVIVAYRWILGEILYASCAFHIDYGWDYDDIVAWMPIPQLPKEDGV